MASPFRVFRKYQKTMLAIAGVVCMFVFVIGDSLFNYFGGSRTARATNDRDAGAVAVRWDGGKLTNRQLGDLVARRKMVNYFLREVEATGRPPSDDPNAAPDLRVQSLIGPETPQQQVEQDVVRNKVFAEAAREAGMKVSDETVVQYLVDWGHGNVSTQDMRRMLKTRSGVTSDYVIDAIREAMLAHNYLLSHQYAFGTVTPQQRWKDWLQVKDFVILEAAAVPAESLLVDVKDPTEAELTAFFEEFKTNEAGPDYGLLARYGIELPSPTPGFRVPRKIDLQFVQANYEELLAKEEPKITDQEIAKFYDEHKDQFEKAQLGLSEVKGAKKDGAKTEAQAANKQSPAGSNAPKAAENQNKAAAPEANKASEPEAKKAAEPESKKGDAPSEEKKSSDGPATKDEKNESKPDDAKKSSSLSHPAKSVFRLTALEQKVEDKDPKANKADEAAKTDGKSEDKSGEPAKPATTQPPSPAASPAAAKPPGPALQSPGASAAQPAGTAPVAPKKPVEYQPLSEVKDIIRRQLAETKITKELDDTSASIWKEIDDSYEKWVGDTLAAEGDKQKRPAPPKAITDLAPIAQKYGWKQGHTGPMSLLGLRDTAVGKNALIADTDTSFLQVLFTGRDLELYQPVKIRNAESKDRFVAMKTSDTPGRVPELAEVRGEVIQAWKKQKSSELAKKRAEELAKKAQDAKATLTSFFADDKSIKVVSTDPFSHLTGGDVSFLGGQFQQQPFRLSQPSEIVAAGPEFLDRAFELKDGEVGVAMNNDHSIAYVIRVVKHEPSLPELRNEYLTESMNWIGENSFLRDHTTEAVSRLVSGLEAQAKVKWERDHDRVKQDAERGET